VSDGWTQATSEMRVGCEWAGESPAAIARASRLANLAWCEKIRARVDEVVEDRQTAESLKAYYPFYCKRPCFHDEYLATFNRPNVRLVDTGGLELNRIVPKGLLFRGRALPGGLHRVRDGLRRRRK